MALYKFLSFIHSFNLLICVRPKKWSELPVPRLWQKDGLTFFRLVRLILPWPSGGTGDYAAGRARFTLVSRSEFAEKNGELMVANSATDSSPRGAECAHRPIHKWWPNLISEAQLSNFRATATRDYLFAVGGFIGTLGASQRHRYISSLPCSRSVCLFLAAAGSHILHMVVQKWHTLLYTITSSNIDWFSNSFRCKNQENICNNTVTKDPTILRVSLHYLVKYTHTICRESVSYWSRVPTGSCSNKQHSSQLCRMSCLAFHVDLRSTSRMERYQADSSNSPSGEQLYT